MEPLDKAAGFSLRPSELEVAIIDYGMGNLRSVQKALETVGAGKVSVVTEPGEITQAHAVILPGVGAFGDAMRNLGQRRLIEPICEAIEEGKPFLGICLGMQLLFTESEEMGLHPGLGILEGRVRRFNIHAKVPHMGWNQLHIERSSPLLRGLPSNSYAYFVHSYFVEPGDTAIVLATTDYEVTFPSVIGRGTVFAVQFHPEKSQSVGLTILRNFVQWACSSSPPST